MLLTAASWLTQKLTPIPIEFVYGVSFSPKYAKELGLDWKKSYQEILRDLEIKRLRVPTYWDQLEPVDGKLDFSETDYMMNEAKKHQTSVILAVGIKQPRWPECHQPDWAANLDKEQRKQRLLKFVKAVVERYKDHPSLDLWQVENEPFFKFGTECDILDKKLLKEEVELVRSTDPNHQIMVTDSGEAMKLPITSMGLSDIFGTTLYRTVYAPKFGYFEYPLLPGFYQLKSQLTHLFAPNNAKTIISELQAEPWSTKPLIETPLEEQLRLFPVEKLTNNLEFAKLTGFDTIYLWGAEWWYYMSKTGHPEYWEEVKRLVK
jgi:hypothetical protein